MADEDKGKGTGDEGKKPGDEETVAKADHEAVTAKLEKTEQDLEDMRLEILTPEYLAFLGTKDKGKGAEETATDTTISDDTFEKMSKKEIFEKAKSEAVTEMKGEFKKDQEARVTSEKAETQKEIAAFARTHEDYNTYRPVMYGLSTDPKNAALSLQELYDAAKEHIKRIHTEPSEEEKKKQAKLAGEKPGGASESYEELAKLSPDDAAKAALEETKGKLGITEIPKA